MFSKFLTEVFIVAWYVKYGPGIMRYLKDNKLV